MFPGKCLSWFIHEMDFFSAFVYNLSLLYHIGTKANKKSCGNSLNVMLTTVRNLNSKSNCLFRMPKEVQSTTD